MYLIGLTGGIATGKSTVSSAITKFGIEVIDGDQIARKVVEPGTRASMKIRATFGPHVYGENGELNREELGKIIFKDPKQRKLLNSITHPEIYKLIAWRCFVCLWKREKFVVLDLPLLFEAGVVTRILDHIVVVRCTPDQQLDRLMARNDFSEDEALSRIGSQMNLDEKCRRASFVIDNSGTLEETEIQVKLLVDQLIRETKLSKRYIIFDAVVFVISSVLTNFVFNLCSFILN